MNRSGSILGATPIRMWHSDTEFTFVWERRCRGSKRRWLWPICSRGSSILRWRGMSLGSPGKLCMSMDRRSFGFADKPGLRRLRLEHLLLWRFDFGDAEMAAQVGQRVEVDRADN